MSSNTFHEHLVQTCFKGSRLTLNKRYRSVNSDRWGQMLSLRSLEPEEANVLKLVVMTPIETSISNIGLIKSH